MHIAKVNGVPLAHSIAGDTSAASTMDVLKAWILECETNHALCQPGLAARLPLRGLDVGLGGGDVHLYESEREVDKYICLSHCWGTFQPLTSTAATISKWKELIPWDELPLTFREAILVTRHLNIRYLWIDSLCIIQGLFRRASPSHLSSLVPTKYENVYVRESLEHRNHHAELLTFGDPEGIQSVLEPLQKRAWALQEYYLASRVVQFTSNELVWECNTCFRCECGNVPIALQDSQATAPKHSLALLKIGLWSQEGNIRPKPYWSDAWATLVTSYTQRHLTFSSDKLPAFSGLVRSLRSLIGGRYLAGIWENEVLFGLSLSVSNSDVVQRPEVYRAPSWTWAAIDARVYWVTFENKTTDVAEFVDFHCDLASADEFGAVKSAHIQLRGIVITAELIYTPRYKLLTHYSLHIGTGKFECRPDDELRVGSTAGSSEREKVALFPLQEDGEIQQHTNRNPPQKCFFQGNHTHLSVDEL
ncbi:hypothetical protein EJ08DRAFT_662493 [Tothia fuscella]|uniref:Heterokaryon incompatibility domain-containing protein n=1 Tax=Tothia fuscella TaxID=1048955 RepID=A0A9P4NMH0_9PEZI|nr:hypothetical protein EJ08DRAFT_662493 [Tothia fuscella]